MVKMNILDYLDKESPEINHALSHGFRKGDSNAVGRALVEEIKARKALVRQLADRMTTVEAVDRQPVDTTGLQASINQQEELINLQQVKIGELEQDVADANSRIDALISGLTVLLQQLPQTNTTDL